jgi:hypothetical protein
MRMAYPWARAIAPIRIASPYSADSVRQWQPNQPEPQLAGQSVHHSISASGVVQNPRSPIPAPSFPARHKVVCKGCGKCRRRPYSAAGRPNQLGRRTLCSIPGFDVGKLFRRRSLCALFLLEVTVCRANTAFVVNVAFPCLWAPAPSYSSCRAGRKRGRTGFGQVPLPGRRGWCFTGRCARVESWGDYCRTSSQRPTECGELVLRQLPKR